jgi:hypothetical protein
MTQQEGNKNHARAKANIMSTERHTFFDWLRRRKGKLKGINNNEGFENLTSRIDLVG